MLQIIPAREFRPGDVLDLAGQPLTVKSIRRPAGATADRMLFVEFEVTHLPHLGGDMLTMHPDTLYAVQRPSPDVVDRVADVLARRWEHIGLDDPRLSNAGREAFRRDARAVLEVVQP